ncbi:MAG: putative lipid II flippase FtsW [Acidobacteria bacterium]|nr:putative lipid II flippase FtsW [Acidobacteriota bacterium]MCG3194466.1 putative peptidoglycan glycosyltransferase FtsW [Thermoanaerobaculia bacterium]MCK6684568.1 putative lipid II flippase FtsW [Thermoanaerobaculia bacterium]
MAKKLASDRYLFLSALTLSCFGLLMIYSASAMQIYLPAAGGPANPFHFVMKQGFALLVGAFLAWAVHAVDYREFNRPAVVAVAMTVLVASLVAVLFAHPVNGTRRWIDLGMFSLQPSEFMKLGLILALAALLSRREGEEENLQRTLIPAAAIVLVPAGLVLAQPDFGTAFSFVAIASAMLFVAGVRLRYFLWAALLLVPTTWAYVMSAPYRKDRLMTFLNPEADPLGKGFQSLQSLIAVGTGGISGLGLGNSKQKLFFLPYPYTDFIYAIVGEELGFIGCVLVLGVFGLLLARGFRAAVNSPDSFGRLAGTGICVMIVFQALLNISVVLALVPTKGIPLPFLSYGGSALWADLIAVGILLNISQHSS